MNKLQPVFTWMNFTSVKQKKKKKNQLTKNTYRRMLSIHTLNMQKPSIWGIHAYVLKV